ILQRRVDFVQLLSKQDVVRRAAQHVCEDGLSVGVEPLAGKKLGFFQDLFDRFRTGSAAPRRSWGKTGWRGERGYTKAIEAGAFLPDAARREGSTFSSKLRIWLPN